jgi:hypothetical protein
LAIAAGTERLLLRSSTGLVSARFWRKEDTVDRPERHSQGTYRTPVGDTPKVPLIVLDAVRVTDA